MRGFFYYKRLRSRVHEAAQKRRMTALTLYPAIDLKDGQCVRLRRGAMDDATVYSSDPAAQARAWQDAGFAWLHVVDLNGAFAGRPVNGAAVAAILDAVTVPVQLGGGIRDMAGIEAWLAAGVRRVILGSAAVKNPGLVREACRAFPGRIVVGIDARDGKVATEGGPRPHRSRPATSHCRSRMPAWPRSSIPTSAATAC